MVEKPEIDVYSLALLRRAIGWEAQVERLSQTVGRSYYWAGGFAAEKLIGYIEVVSDGIDDAYIRNLIVHPHYQRRGAGSELLRLATEQIKKDGIKMTNVLFKPELSAFYRKAGFKIISGGLIDNCARL